MLLSVIAGRFIPIFSNGIFFTSSCCLSPVVSKASAGAMELLNVYSVSDILLFLEVISILIYHH